MKLKKNKRLNKETKTLKKLNLKGIALVELIVTIAISSLVLVMGTTIFILSQTIYNQAILDSATTYVVENLVDHLESSLTKDSNIYTDESTNAIYHSIGNNDADPQLIYENKNNYILDINTVRDSTIYSNLVKVDVTIHYLYSKEDAYIVVTKLFA